MTQIGAVPKESMELLSKVSSGMVIDALAMSGINGGVVGVLPARGFEDSKIIGTAVTVQFGLPRPDSPKMNAYQIIRQSPPGTVLVMDGKGMNAHFTGDNQGECAKRQGMVGVVVYGGARDISGYRAIGMPLFCTTPATRPFPSDLPIVGHNVPIEIGGVQVKPGDIIFGDEDGVVVIPAEGLATLMENMQVMFEVEDGMQKAIQSDAPLEEIKAVIAKKHRH